MIINKIVDIADAAGTTVVFNDKDIEGLGVSAKVLSVILSATTTAAASINLESNTNSIAVANLAAGGSGTQELKVGESDGLRITTVPGAVVNQTPIAVSITTGATTNGKSFVSVDLGGE